MFLSNWGWKKNIKNIKNIKNKITDDFWDTDGSDDDTDIFCDSPPSRYFCLKTKNKREKYIKNLISFKKKWAPWNEPGAFF